GRGGPHWTGCPQDGIFWGCAAGPDAGNLRCNQGRPGPPLPPWRRPRSFLMSGVSGSSIDGYRSHMTATEAPVRPPDRGPSGPPPRTVLLVGGVILLAIALLAVIAGAFYSRVGRAD